MNSSQPQPHPHHILTTLRILLEIAVIAVFIVTFLVQPSRIPSASMEPTLHPGQFLLVDKQSYAEQSYAEQSFAHLLPPTTLHRGDIIVFHFPSKTGETPGKALVKRVIALPGDHLRLRSGRVLLNGVPIDEPYAFYSPSRPNRFRDDFPSLAEADPNVDPAWWIQLRNSLPITEADPNPTLTVPPNHYFVLGDNRNESQDSRYWGFVPREALIGRPLVPDLPASPATASADHSLLATLLNRWHTIHPVH